MSMMVVDRALAERQRREQPIRAVVVGAGFMGRNITRQIARLDGMDVVGVVNRTPERAAANLVDAGYERVEQVADRAQAERAMSSGVRVITDDPSVLCSAAGVDVVIETTGTLEFGARVAVSTLESGKHLVLDNAELDSSVGPLLKAMADSKGVVFTNIDGDEPGVAMNLIRFVRSIGVRPVMAGNIKGFLNHERNPQTQEGFARQHGQDPAMAASFADGTKLAAECTVLANATGFGVAIRGMNGFELGNVSEILGRHTADDLLERPLVDYVLGAAPGSGVFVVGYESDPERRSALQYLKMGPGPLYLFTRPFHLPHVEAPLSAARAVLFDDPTVTPLGAPVCEVVAVAKRDLEPGEELDSIGGFTWYGLVDNAAAVAQEGLATMADTYGAVVRNPVAKGSPIALADLELRTDTLLSRLRREQAEVFGS